jgi:DNA-binding NarL/FixJ family response regulator
MNTPERKKLNIIFIEDNPNYRKVLREALDDNEHVTISSDFGNCERALKYLASSSAITPDIVLLDLELPGMGGLDAIVPIQTQCPKTRIIVLSRSEDETKVVEAISRGASGYLLKSSSLEKIEQSIQDVGAGGASLDPQVANYILRAFQSVRPGHKVENGLSKRQHEVLELLAEGLLKKEIADRLDLSYHTVVMHVRHIYDKLQVQNVSAAVAKAIKKGII